MRALTVRQICLENFWTCALQHGRAAMKYKDVAHLQRRLAEAILMGL